MNGCEGPVIVVAGGIVVGGVHKAKSPIERWELAERPQCRLQFPRGSAISFACNVGIAGFVEVVERLNDRIAYEFAVIKPCRCACGFSLAHVGPIVRA